MKVSATVTKSQNLIIVSLRRYGKTRAEHAFDAALTACEITNRLSDLASAFEYDKSRVFAKVLEAKGV